MATDVVLGVNLADAEAFIAEHDFWADAEPWSPASFNRLHKWYPIGNVINTPTAVVAKRNRHQLDRMFKILVRASKENRGV